MVPCAICGDFILFGGIPRGSARLCNPKCAQIAARHDAVRMALPPSVIDNYVETIRRGPCPKCQQNRTVDFHSASSIWSLLIVSRVQHTRVLSCRRCGRRHQVTQLAGTMLVGWWSIPAGIVLTPILILRNLRELARRDRSTPSRELISMALSQLETRDPDTASEPRKS